MPYYTNYKSNNNSISEYLETSENRIDTSLSDNFKNFNFNNSTMNFAQYISFYHPFYVDTKIQYKYTNKVNNTINKGCAAKGFAPILIPRYSDISSGGTNIIEFKGTGSAVNNGTIRIRQENDPNPLKEIPAPTCIILGVIGSGGGGAGGSSWWVPGKSYGGGCGAFVALHIELPYKSTEWTEVVRIKLGAGGNGGSNFSSGSDGEPTTIEFKDSGEWKKIVTIEGGKGGNNIKRDSIISPSTDLAISRATINIVDKSILGNQGYGRVTIVESVRNWSWGVGNFAYMPGNYWDPTQDDNYEQVDENFGRLTSSINPEYSIITGTKDYNYIDDGRSIWYCGKASVFAAGGKAIKGFSAVGGYGAGGSSGSAGTNVFNANISKGGHGGPATFKIYW